MRRRSLFGAIALGASRTILPAQAQRRVEVGWLSYGDQHDPNLSAFLSDLRRLGWREEANLTLVPRYTQTPADLFSHAQELLSRNQAPLLPSGFQQRAVRRI
jgi:hypothetical protein